MVSLPARAHFAPEASAHATTCRFAFERTFIVGSEDGAGGEAPVLIAEATETVPVPAGEEEEEAEAEEEEEEEEEEGDEEEEEAAEEDSTVKAAVKATSKHKRGVDMVAFRSRQRTLRLVHGSLMIAAWLIAAPAGALAARYFKHTGAFWFDAHRVLQGSAVVATVFGAAIALGILHPTILNLGVHGKLGICVVAFACFQPLNAFSRPAKTAGKTRAAWKRLHTAIGWSAIGAGALNCVVGANMMIAMEGDSALAWYAVLSLAAALPLLGAALLANARKGGSPLVGLLTVRATTHARSA